MPPLLLLGTLLLTTPILADVKHVLDTSPQAVNYLASEPQRTGDFWWMSPSSPLKAAYEYYKKCNEKGNCLPAAAPEAPAPQPFRPQDSIGLNIKNNPFLNGNFQPNQGNANFNNNEGASVTIDISKNPFLSGVVTTGSGAQIPKEKEGFLGVQPVQPFTGNNNINNNKPLDQVECRGAGFICVDNEVCVDGIVNKNGEGLLQVRSDVHYCNKNKEVCCKLHDAPANDHKQILNIPNLNEITAGKSSVPGSTIKFTGGAGLSPGLIQVIPQEDSSEIKPRINLVGESGHQSSGSSSTKTIRQTSPFSSTIDYSNAQVGNDVRFASTFQGPAYLPPIATSPPTRPPQTYVPVSPTTPRSPPVFNTIPVIVSQPSHTVTQNVYTTTPRPYSQSTSREYIPPRSTTSREYIPPSSTNNINNQYVPSRPQTPYQPSGSTPRPFQPSITPQKPYQPCTSQQPNQPFGSTSCVTPQEPYQPSSSTPRPYQPNVTPQKPYQPCTPEQSYQPSGGSTFRPDQPCITPQKPYQPSGSTPRPYQPSITPQKPYQPSTSITPQQPYQPSGSTPRPYQPSITPQKPYQPSTSITPQQPYQPSGSTPRPYQPSITPQKPYQPSTSITPQQPYQPSGSTPRPHQPSITPQQPYQPSTPRPFQPQPTYRPSTNAPEYLPPVSGQPSSPRPNPFVPSETPTPYQPSPSSPTPRPYSPSPSYPTPTPYQPGPSSPTPRPYSPSPSYPTPTPYQPSPSSPTHRPYQPSPSYPTPRPYQPSPSSPQPRPTLPPYQPSPSTDGYTYTRPGPSSPQPSRPTPPPYQPGHSSPQPTRPPYSPSTEGYTYPRPSPTRPTPPPYHPSPYQPTTDGYTYTRPNPTRPTPPPYKPSPSSPQPRPTLPPYQPSQVTNGYSYPTPSPPFISQRPQTTPAPDSNRPSTTYVQPSSPSTLRPYQPYQPSSTHTFPSTTIGPNPGGYSYPTPTPTFDYPPNRTPSSSNTVEQTFIPSRPHTYLPPGPSTGSTIIDIGVPSKPSTPRIPYTPDNTPESANNFNFTQFPPNPNNNNIVDQNPPTSCAAALKCVQEIYCTADGFVSPVPVVLTKEQEISRVPTTVCQDQEAGITGKCCRDPNYKDPWPSANLVNGVDDGQYAEDDNLGQYRQDLQRPVRSNAGGPRQDYSSVRNIAANQNLPQPTCGERNLNTNPQAPGPLDVNFAEIPWQAMILRDSNRSLLCGGAIIRRNAILTNAHCVEGLETSDILIKGGEWKLGIDEEPLPFQIVKVSAIVRHPQFKSGSLINDLAILVLEEKLRPAKNIGTICLPPPNQIPTENCIATGWGKRILQLHAKGAIMHSINVNIMDNKQCQDTLAEKFQHTVQNYSPNTLCGYSNINQCKVDYGSALACSSGNNQYTLSGIFSWDTGCKTEGQIGGYIAPDVEWIENSLNKPLNELKQLDREYRAQAQQ